MVRRPLKTETAANHSTGKAPQASRSARWASCLLVCGLPLVVLAAMYGCFAAVVAAAIESSKSAAHAAFASSAAAAGAELRSSWAQLVATLDSAARAVEAFPAGANDTALNNLVFRAVSREQLAGVRMGAPHAGVQY
ncbi:unnamed protein product [Symbiodinium sp. KB8]|nr:unnamed protein product [Symbiodinium sp. KB8]